MSLRVWLWPLGFWFDIMWWSIRDTWLSEILDGNSFPFDTHTHASLQSSFHGGGGGGGQSRSVGVRVVDLRPLTHSFSLALSDDIIQKERLVSSNCFCLLFIIINIYHAPKTTRPVALTRLILNWVVTIFLFNKNMQIISFVREFKIQYATWVSRLVSYITIKLKWFCFNLDYCYHYFFK